MTRFFEGFKNLYLSFCPVFPATIVSIFQVYIRCVITIIHYFSKKQIIFFLISVSGNDFPGANGFSGILSEHLPIRFPGSIVLLILYY
jgi:hypothetical protein